MQKTLIMDFQFFRICLDLLKPSSSHGGAYKKWQPFARIESLVREKQRVSQGTVAVMMLLYPKTDNSSGSYCNAIPMKVHSDK
jgi:hypothetical protein